MVNSDDEWNDASPQAGDDPFLAREDDWEFVAPRPVCKSKEALRVPTATEMTTVPLSELRFSHSSIFDRFKDGGSVEDFRDLLRTPGAPHVNKILRKKWLKVVCYRGRYHSMDNRRLWAMKEALDPGVMIKIQLFPSPADFGEALFFRKMSTRNQGKSAPLRRKLTSAMQNVRYLVVDHPGVFIGAGGSGVQGLQEKFGVGIRTSSRGPGRGCVVTIGGTSAETVQAAYQAIKTNGKYCIQPPESPSDDEDAVLRTGWADFNFEKTITGIDFPEALLTRTLIDDHQADDRVSVKFEVRHPGGLIGTSGSTIKRLRKQFNVELKVLGDAKEAKRKELPQIYELSGLRRNALRAFPEIEKAGGGLADRGAEGASIISGRGRKNDLGPSFIRMMEDNFGGIIHLDIDRKTCYVSGPTQASVQQVSDQIVDRSVRIYYEVDVRIPTAAIEDSIPGPPGSRDSSKRPITTALPLVSYLRGHQKEICNDAPDCSLMCARRGHVMLEEDAELYVLDPSSVSGDAESEAAGVVSAETPRLSVVSVPICGIRACKAIAVRNLEETARRFVERYHFVRVNTIVPLALGNSRGGVVKSLWNKEFRVHISPQQQLGEGDYLVKIESAMKKSSSEHLCHAAKKIADLCMLVEERCIGVPWLTKKSRKYFDQFCGAIVPGCKEGLVRVSVIAAEGGYESRPARDTGGVVALAGYGTAPRRALAHLQFIRENYKVSAIAVAQHRALYAVLQNTSLATDWKKHVVTRSLASSLSSTVVDHDCLSMEIHGDGRKLKIEGHVDAVRAVVQEVSANHLSIEAGRQWVPGKKNRGGSWEEKKKDGGGRKKFFLASPAPILSKNDVGWTVDEVEEKMIRVAQSESGVIEFVA